MHHMAETAADKELGRDLVDLGLEMESVRSLIEPEYADAEKYVTPWLSPFYDHEGLPPTRPAIYDNTAIKANRRMGNGLMGMTMGPALRFMILGLFGRYGEALDAADIPGAAHWLRQVEDGIFGVLARSNFYPEGAVTCMLVGSHGSPTMWCDPPTYPGQPWSFVTQHPKSIWFSENDRKEVDNHRRKFRLQNKDLIRRFGASLGEEHTKLKEWRNAPAKWSHILHQVYPNDEFDPSSLNTKKKKLRSVYFLPDGCVLENKGLDFDRYLTWRWQPGSDQVYSESVTMDAMPGIKTLQQMRKTLMQMAQMAAESPVNAPDSLRGKVKMVPNGINYFDDNKPNSQISRIPLAGNYPVTFEDYRMQKNDTGEFYYDDLWTMIANQPASSRMTAYEVSQRVGEKANVLGPVIANHRSEFADPLISMIFNVEMKAGRLPPPPPSLRSLAGSDGRGVRMIPHYIGPLEMAQRRNGMMDGFMTAMQAIMPLAQVRQEILDHLDFDKMVRLIIQSSGAKEEIVNGMDQVMAIRQGRAQAAQQQRKDQMQIEMMKNLKGMNQAPEDGSIGGALNRTLGIPERQAV